jgi:LacI family transcriptional regulator
MINLADVAKRARVSPTTASFVLNNRQKEWHISDATTKRVLDAATEMGYQRNELARSVASGKNFVLGFVKSPLADEQDSKILNGILAAAVDEGYLVKIFYWEREEQRKALVKHCAEQRLAGVIMRTFVRFDATRHFFEALAHYGISVAFVDDDISIEGTSCVTSDDDSGYRLAIRHLADLGHTKFALIAGDSVHVQSQLRTMIYRKIMEESGLPVPRGSILNSNWGLERSEELTRRLFENPKNRPTALMCAGDEIAAVAMRTLSRMNLRVPEDVSVVGYSDFGFSKLLNPPLTTVAQPFTEMGSVATRLLLESLKNESRYVTANTVKLPTSLVIRESTAPPNVS